MQWTPRRGSRLALTAGFLGIALSAIAAAATFPVTKTADTADGVCDSDCSLREAIIAANAAAGADTVVVPAGTYMLTIAGPSGEDAAANGDLDITGDLTVSGAGASTAIVDGNGSTRVFEIHLGVGAAASFSGLTIRNGSVADFGGGINNRFSANVNISDCIITNNSAPDGGGINNNSGGAVTITNSTISGNTATSGPPGGGGILNNSSGSITLTGSTVSGNTAAAGGGLSNNSCGTMTITNSTISGNTKTGTSFGGGGTFKNSSGPVTLTNVTIIGNSSTTSGGGLFNNSASGLLSLRNTIVANSPSGGDCSGTITSLGNNLASDASCNLVAAGDLPSTNPQVGPLASNGGPTQTHALLGGSPAINAAGGCPPPATDQRGVTRPQGAACEIGSFECQSTECTGIGQTPTPTPTGAPPTATPTGVPPTLTPTSTPTVSVGQPVNVPMLSFPMLALLGLALATAAVLLLKR